MSAAALIEQAAADGVMLAIAQDDCGTLKVQGEQHSIDHWLPVIREHKTAILKALLATATASGDLEAIRDWLSFIGENDPAIINDVLQRCQHDTEAHQYFLRRAAEVGYSCQEAVIKPWPFGA